MLFNSLEFIFVFLPVAVALHFLAARYGIVASVGVTTLTSLFFYAWWKPPFVLLPVLSIILNYSIAQGIRQANPEIARTLLFFGITANLIVLGYFKYSDFFLSVFQQRLPSEQDVPLALSFTTFVQIAFLVETARRPGSIAFPRYAMFVSFFPHLIAGPIVRWTELGTQLGDKSRFRVTGKTSRAVSPYFAWDCRKKFYLPIIW